MLSNKSIPADERLILALDVPDVEEAKRLADTLGDAVKFYKIGLELFMTGRQYELIEWLAERGKKIFADVKFFDIPNTVASALKQLRRCRPTFVTVHGDDGILQAACGERDGAKILAVTVLTSLSDNDLRNMGFSLNREQLVLSRAKRALEIGCDGVISSGMEAALLRRELGGNFLIVCPGIRPNRNRKADDQKATVDVEEAFENGADYIVVGRPVREAADPKKAAEEIQRRITALFA